MNLRLRTLMIPALAALGAGAADARVTVAVYPNVQFVKQGSGVTLKARVRGGNPARGLRWEILGPDRGILESLSLGRVRHHARNGERSVAPWTTVQVRVTSEEDPRAYADAAVEDLPAAHRRDVQTIRVVVKSLDDPMQTRDAEILLSSTAGASSAPFADAFPVVAQAARVFPGF